MKIRITQDCDVQGRPAAPGEVLDVDVALAVDLVGAGYAKALDPLAMKRAYHEHLARERQRNERLYGSWASPWTR